MFTKPAIRLLAKIQILCEESAYFLFLLGKGADNLLNFFIYYSDVNRDHQIGTCISLCHFADSIFAHPKSIVNTSRNDLKCRH